MTGRATPETVDSHTLGPSAAHRLWNWLLVRQGLAAHTRLATVEDIADAALGLHAARLPSPFATVAARAADTATTLTLFDSAVRAQLITVRCMRKTLHTLPLPLAAAAHAATLRFRERDALRGVVNAGHSQASVDAATDAIVELLTSSGPLFHRRIEAQLAEAAIPVPVTRLALKLAWERGTLAYLNQAPDWNREVRVFALTADAYPDLDTRMDTGTAVAQLMAAYIDRYGPVSIRDATWWSALSRTAVVDGMQQAAIKLVELITPWTASPLYMSADRFAEFADAPPTDCETGVGLLAHEDVALKAYFETRCRYMGALAPSAAFNQIGEALPTVILDGQVVGTWAWEERTARVRPRLITGMVPRGQRKEIHAAAAQLTTTLRSGMHRLPVPRIADGQLALLPAG